MKILIVDDMKFSRTHLAKALKELGHEIIEAEDGIQAYKILENQPEINFLISDWIMPQMTGLELCGKIRKTNFNRYIYIILLTSKSDTAALVEGLDTGADDFISKPFVFGELKARINAGARIIGLERTLEERNTKLMQVNEQLTNAYDTIKSDLEAAAKMQTNLLPDSKAEIKGLNFKWLFIPCVFVAGDILNFFYLDEDHAAFYLLDVAGHGIPSAMMSVTLSRVINPFFTGIESGNKSIKEDKYSPAKIVGKLNNEFQSEKFFTMVYGIINLKTGKTKLTQAGHPPIIHLKHSGEIQCIGSGGFPVGVFPDVEFDEEEIIFEKGDRLFIYSDGVTECNDVNEEQFEVPRLSDFFKKRKSVSLSELLIKLERRLRVWRGKSEFDDDVSVLGVERL